MTGRVFGFSGDSYNHMAQLAVTPREVREALGRERKVERHLGAVDLMIISATDAGRVLVVYCREWQDERWWVLAVADPSEQDRRLFRWMGGQA